MFLWNRKRVCRTKGDRGVNCMSKQIKLGVVATEFPPAIGGMEQHAVNLAHSLAEHCQVTVFTTAEHRGVQYEKTPYDIVPCLTLDLEYDVNTLKRSGFPDVWLVLNAGYAPLSLEIQEPVVVYCHGNDFLKPWISGKRGGLEYIPRFAARTPYLWSKAVTLRSMVARKRIRKGLSHAAGVYVNSSFTKELLRASTGTIANTVKVHPPGIASHFFLADTKRSITAPDAELRLLTVARLSSAARKKNVDNLIRAVARVAVDLPVRLTIVGDGDLASDLKSLAGTLGLGDTVSFLGILAGNDVRSELEKTDLFVLASKSSKTDVESFGIVYAEAAAAGVPSLISRSGGAVDAVADGVSGIIIEGSDDIAIAEGIKRFARSRHQFDSRKIREFAEQFQWSLIAERLFHDICVDSGITQTLACPN